MHRDFISPELIINLPTDQLDEFAGINLSALINLKAIIIYQKNNIWQQNDIIKTKNFIAKQPSQEIDFFIKAPFELINSLPLSGVLLHYNEKDIEENIQLIKKTSPDLIIIIDNIKNKHQAINAAQAGADSLYFGKINNINELSHATDIKLSEWWSEVTQIPAILQSGINIEDIKQNFNSKVDFIAININQIKYFDKKSIISYINKIQQDIMHIGG